MEHGWRGTSGWGFLRGVQGLHGPGSWLVKNWLFFKKGSPVVGCLGLFFFGGDELYYPVNVGGL